MTWRSNSPLPSASDADDWDKLVVAFNDTYRRVYAASARSPELGYSMTGAILRARCRSPSRRSPRRPRKAKFRRPTPSPGTARFYRKKEWLDAAIYKMESLRPGNTIIGPAIIESDATTFVVPDGFETSLDGHRLFHLRQF